VAEADRFLLSPLARASRPSLPPGHLSKI